jgi:hypothetical protein
LRKRDTREKKQSTVKRKRDTREKRQSVVERKRDRHEKRQKVDCNPTHFFAFSIAATTLSQN